MKRFHAGMLGFLIGAVVWGVRAGTVLEVEFPRDRTFDTCTRDAAIDAPCGTGLVQLADETFIIHAPGDKLYGTTPEKGFARKLAFSAGLIGCKIFPLEDARSRGATLSVFGPAGGAQFNGHDVVFTQIQHQAGWSFAELPADWLRAGDNELVMTSGFRLPQDRTTDPPAFSRVSRDGGTNWVPAAGGEFLVTLRLRRHPREGVITSPPIDLHNPTEADVIAPLATVVEVVLDRVAHTPPGTALVLETRAGRAPLPDTRWSAWRPAAAGPVGGRYLQWRARLLTDNPLVTPVLSHVAVRVRLEEHAVDGASQARLQDLADYPVVAGSAPYGFQRPSRRLARLRREYRLDEVVAAGRTDFERLILLRNWVRRQWRGNDGFGGRWNALSILAAPPGGKGMCVHYGNLFAQCALALGYCARPVIINGHFIADVWSEEHGRWVAMDVEAIYPPVGFDRYATAHYVRADTREPLSVLDVHRSYHAAREAGRATIDDVIQVFTHDDDAATAVPHDRIRPVDELRTFARFGYPPRNDHLDRDEPWEEYHGQDHYHSNGYLWWRGGVPAPQYSWSTSRRGDIEWTINRVDLGLTAGQRPERLIATSRTFTPNFEAFQYRTNGGEWRRHGGSGRDRDRQWAAIDWRLQPGDNRFEIRAVNRFGHAGAISRAEVRLDCDAPRSLP